MRRWGEPGSCHEALTIPETELEASALFFPFRDAAERKPDPAMSIGAWRGEIDVVALVPGHVVIGIELKVLSTISGLAEQMRGQLDGLSLLAARYDCSYFAQVALASDFPSDLSPSVNRLSFVDLQQALVALGAATAPERDILAAAARQVEHVIRLTERSSDQSYVHVRLERLLEMGRDPAYSSKWVGVYEGLPQLDVSKRPRWKVAEERLGGNWYPLHDVIRCIEACLASEPTPKRDVIAQSYRRVTLDELKRMARDPANASKWVGAEEGIEALRIDTRKGAGWKVAATRANGNWHPLPVVVSRIEEILGATKRPKDGRHTAEQTSCPTVPAVRP
jgi:hypothetical protein